MLSGLPKSIGLNGRTSPDTSTWSTPKARSSGFALPATAFACGPIGFTGTTCSPMERYVGIVSLHSRSHYTLTGLGWQISIGATLRRWTTMDNYREFELQVR